MDAASLKVTSVLAAVAAGTTAQNGSSVDMAGWEGVIFIARVGALTATAVTSLKAQQSSDNGSSDAFADLAGSLQSWADDDDGKCIVLDVKRPQERYVRPVLSRGTANAVIDGIIAIQYGPRTKDTSDDATTVLSRLQLVSPAEGTA